MSTPLRVNNGLYKEAEAEGSLMNRSVAKQVEFWAELGKRVARTVSPTDMLALMQGIAKIQVEVTGPTRVVPAKVFAAVEKARSSSALESNISQDQVFYEASQTKPGLLDRVMPNGERQTGRFENGSFILE